MSTTTLPRAKIASNKGPGLLTAADLEAFPRYLPSGDFKYELDKGRLIVMTPPGGIHAHRQARIIYDLYRAQDAGFGNAYGEVSIILRRKPDTVRVPDAAFILKESLPVTYSKEGYLETIPEIVVEVRSKNDTKKAIQAKTEEYFEAGVKEVWVLDPAAKTVAVNRADGNTVVFKGDQSLTSVLLPGFSAPMAALFAGE